MRGDIPVGRVIAKNTNPYGYGNNEGFLQDDQHFQGIGQVVGKPIRGLNAQQYPMQ
jgi:hypothetical protein